MRWVVAVCLALAACLATAERILLVPLDSRPAAGQFAQMIGAMANVEINQPPYHTLGRFTAPGNPEAILDWLRRQDFSDVSAVVVSTDMIAYGGLIASRTNEVSYETALRRLKSLEEIRKQVPQVRFYAFTAIMRLTPTATRTTAAWRLNLGRYAELRERYRRDRDPALLNTIRNLQAKIPGYEIQKYEWTRQRNHQIQQALVRMTAYNAFDYLILGQDDAQPNGPHVPETEKLRETVSRLGIAGKIYFCEGIDQHSNVLVSRALLRANDWVPRVRLVYADEAGKTLIAPYESKTIEQSLRDQILASGARPAEPGGGYDYTLFLNTPEHRQEQFEEFLRELGSEVDQGFPVSVADVNLGKDGTGDPQLFGALWENNRMMRLLSYSAWNTAGNTMGTAIPAANVYLLSRKIGSDPLRREVAQREFLLHRFVNDFSYHKYTRPQAYTMVDTSTTGSREETYGLEFEEINNFVKRDLGKQLERTFREQFMGKRFFAGNRQYEL
ncbi:MAG TPA: DUF4127 family protein, partial [Fimbriimonadaceae bacterium]|nr:DUF4127 family protein [Fimbriimonadaceae bacterium]